MEHALLESEVETHQETVGRLEQEVTALRESLASQTEGREQTRRRQTCEADQVSRYRPDQIKRGEAGPTQTGGRVGQTRSGCRLRCTRRICVSMVTLLTAQAAGWALADLVIGGARRRRKGGMCCRLVAATGSCLKNESTMGKTCDSRVCYTLLT